MALTFSGILDTVKPVETYQTRNGVELKGRYNQNADRVFNELRVWKIEKGGRG